jgi:hypothetical protein
MSYARHSEDSDVYVFLSITGHLECCSCPLMPGHFRADSTQAMLAHLQAHLEAGHKVPRDTLFALREDEAANDAYIEGHKDARAAAALGLPVVPPEARWR